MAADTSLETLSGAQSSPLVPTQQERAMEVSFGALDTVLYDDDGGPGRGVPVGELEKTWRRGVRVRTLCAYTAEDGSVVAPGARGRVLEVADEGVVVVGIDFDTCTTRTRRMRAEIVDLAREGADDTGFLPPGARIVCPALDATDDKGVQVHVPRGATGTITAVLADDAKYCIAFDDGALQGAELNVPCHVVQPPPTAPPPPREPTPPPPPPPTDIPPIATPQLGATPRAPPGRRSSSGAKDLKVPQDGPRGFVGCLTRVLPACIVSRLCGLSSATIVEAEGGDSCELPEWTVLTDAGGAPLGVPVMPPSPSSPSVASQSSQQLRGVLKTRSRVSMGNGSEASLTSLSEGLMATSMRAASPSATHRPMRAHRESSIRGLGSPRVSTSGRTSVPLVQACSDVAHRNRRRNRSALPGSPFFMEHSPASKPAPLRMMSATELLPSC